LCKGANSAISEGETSLKKHIMRVSLYCNFVKSPVGKIGVVYTNKEVLRIGLDVKEKKFLRVVEAELGCKVAVRESPLFKKFTRELNEYFDRKRKRFDIPFAVEGSVFQKKVWSYAMKIPYGKTITYGELAKRIGKPGAARAVGGALKKNRVPILVPCHRVIGMRGNLVGFQPSLNIKGFLLSLEGALPPCSSKCKTPQ
jgi:methylated-DNA-[protein]-cysteine S-methyltransferase